MVEREDRPTISLDVYREHGRAVLGVRVNGMTVASLLVDVEELEPIEGGTLKRFCPFCGEGIDLFSSASHACS